MGVVTATEARQVLGVRVLLDQLRAVARVDVPRRRQRAALGHIDELETALLSPVPDVTRVAQLERWFADHTPTIRGAVARTLHSPVVGQVIAAGGAIVTEDFLRLIA